MRSLPVLHGLLILIRTVVHAVVWYFKRKTLYCFYILLRNRYIHTFTCVFELIWLSSRSFSLDSEYVFIYFKSFYLIEDILFIELLKWFFYMTLYDRLICFYPYIFFMKHCVCSTKKYQCLANCGLYAPGASPLLQKNHLADHVKELLLPNPAPYNLSLRMLMVEIHLY